MIIDEVKVLKREYADVLKVKIRRLRNSLSLGGENARGELKEGYHQHRHLE